MPSQLRTQPPAGYQSIKNMRGRFLIETDSKLYYRKNRSSALVLLNNVVYDAPAEIFNSYGGAAVLPSPSRWVRANAGVILTAKDVLGSQFSITLLAHQETNIRIAEIVSLSTATTVLCSLDVPPVVSYLAELDGELFYESAKDLHFEIVDNVYEKFKFERT